MAIALFEAKLKDGEGHVRLEHACINMSLNTCHPLLNVYFPTHVLAKIKISYTASALKCAMMDADDTPETMEHKFLAPGHTHMEVDSMHATIEKAKKQVTG